MRRLFKELFDRKVDGTYTLIRVVLIVRTKIYDVGNIAIKTANTAMKHWEMCAACRKEYEDPNDRRYQSEMNSCPNCGPDYRLYHLGNVYDGEMMFQIAVGLLHSGEMIAVKSNGGYHLVCDATNIDAIKRLRKKIHRERKPFAMMAKDMEAVERDRTCFRQGAQIADVPTTADRFVGIKRRSSGSS